MCTLQCFCKRKITFTSSSMWCFFRGESYVSAVFLQRWKLSFRVESVQFIQFSAAGGLFLQQCRCTRKHPQCFCKYIGALLRCLIYWVILNIVIYHHFFTLVINGVKRVIHWHICLLSLHRFSKPWSRKFMWNFPKVWRKSRMDKLFTYEHIVKCTCYSTVCQW
jgi:hypothetical protein